MDKYTIEIRVDVKYLECECSPNTPCWFADKIRQLAKDYFAYVINPKPNMLYSCLERHVGGSYWYHGDTFQTREQAETFIAEWIPWDPDREKRIIEHEKLLPNETCYTFDFHTFESFGIILCKI